MVSSCLCVQPTPMFNQGTDFHETMYAHHATRHHPQLYTLQFHHQNTNMVTL